MRCHPVALYNFIFPILIKKILTNYPVAGVVLEDTETNKQTNKQNTEQPQS